MFIQHVKHLPYFNGRQVGSAVFIEHRLDDRVEDVALDGVLVPRNID